MQVDSGLKNLTLIGNETYIINALTLDEDFKMSFNVTLKQRFFIDYFK